jgi:hypothetical protein
VLVEGVAAALFNALCPDRSKIAKRRPRPHRDTERAIAHAGFRPQTARHDLEFPAWVPMPVSEVVIGRAVKPS